MNPRSGVRLSDLPITRDGVSVGRVCEGNGEGGMGQRLGGH
jgi:hypothetical protein